MVWEHFFQQSGKNTSDIFSVLISHSFPLLQRCFDNCVLTQIQIQNLLTAFSVPSNLQPKMKSASSPYYYSSQIKMFKRQSLLTQVCPRKVSAAARAQVGGHLLNLCRRSIPPTLRWGQVCHQVVQLCTSVHQQRLNIQNISLIFLKPWQQDHLRMNVAPDKCPTKLCNRVQVCIAGSDYMYKIFH